MQTTSFCLLPLLRVCKTFKSKSHIRANHDIEFNPSKSSAMYIDSRKAGNVQSMTIGGKILNVVTSFSYLGHIICNDLSDDADLKAKSRQMYAWSSNTLCQEFHVFHCYQGQASRSLLQ